MKIGFLLKDIGGNQLALDLITSINNYIKNNKNKHDLVVFIENIEQPIKIPSCPVMQSAEIWSFDGMLISTSMSTTLKSLKCIGPTKRAFYIYSPEWFSQQYILQYENTHQIYMHPSLDIITRTEDYDKLFKSCFNRTTKFIWDDLDITKIIQEYDK